MNWIIKVIGLGALAFVMFAAVSHVTNVVTPSGLATAYSSQGTNTTSSAGGYGSGSGYWPGAGQSPETGQGPGTGQVPTTQTQTGSGISNTTVNSAGYAATGQDITNVHGNWVVPTAGGSGEAADATWIGIGGVTSNDLIQTGTQNVVGPDGSVQTSAFYELLPDDATMIPNFSVQAGDTVTANITETGTDMWQIVLKDTTSGASFSTSVSYASSLSSAEWVEEDPSDGISEVPLDSFGTVTFRNAGATENGTSENLGGRRPATKHGK